MKPWNVEICDVTLRDGEQTPGVSFTCEEKMEIAAQIDAVGVEVIEAGFPVVSENEKECVRAVCNMGLDARVCCLSRALKQDVDAAIDCGVDLVSIFFATSDRHIRVKYRCSREEMTDQALGMIEYARDHGIAVRFAAEDASRTDTEILKDLYLRGAEYGAEYSGFADTVGFLTPLEMETVMRDICSVVPNKVAVHCHNDMGYAGANTITAAACGAFQLHTTVNGIGERAGNAPLEEVLVALRMKGGVDRYDLTRIPFLSEIVQEHSGIRMMATKPIVGRNVFSHESGIHIAAILEDPETYEYILPEYVGRHRKFILGKHTGRKGLEHILQKTGTELSPEQIVWVLNRVKEISEGKCAVTQDVLLRVIEKAKGGPDDNPV